MREAHTLSIAVELPWAEDYESIWRRETFPRWASGLAKSWLRPDGERWLAEGPNGPVRIRFTGHNPFGLMDHYVDVGGGAAIYVPLRVIAKGDDTEIILTLFRQPDMSDVEFRTDIEWVQRDLTALRKMLTNRTLS